MSLKEYNRIYFGKGDEEKIYITTDLFNVNWGFRKMSDFKISVSGYGGLAAFIPKDLRIDPTIYIHNFKDSGIDEFQVDDFSYEEILYCGWTIHLQFFIILKNCSILEYKLFSKFPKIHKPVSESEIAIAADMKENVVCFVTNKLNCYVLNTSDDFTSTKLSKVLIPANSSITSISIVKTNKDDYSESYILIGLSTGNIIRRKSNTWEVASLGLYTGGTNITYMTTSLDGTYTAICLKKTSILILPSSFDSKILEYKSEAAVDSLCWISDKVLIAGYNNNGLIFLSTDKIWKRNAFKSELMELIDKNGELLLINDEQVRLIHIEPPSLISIHKIGSTSPESLLYDASESFYRSDKELNENMTQEIPSGQLLHDGIMQCIDASMYSLEPDKQKSYIRAALYGRCFYQQDDYDYNIYDSTEILTKVTRSIRVCNTLFYEFGMPITVPELEKMDSNDLLTQLSNYRLFDCAIQICDFLQKPKSDVLKNWCCLLIDNGEDKSDSYLFERIKSKYDTYHNIPLQAIAKYAYIKDRLPLALKLLEIEPDIKLVIGTLIYMRQFDLAFKKSESSSDTSIMLSTINTLYKASKENLALFYQMIKETKKSLALFLFYNQAQNSDLYQEIVDNLDIFPERLKLTYYKSPEEELRGLKICQQYITQCSKTNKYIYDFYLDIVNQHIALIEENKTSKRFSLQQESNVRRTLYNLYLNNEDASKYIKKCKIDEQLVLYTRLEAYVSMKNYANLASLFNEKKIPPIEFIKYLFDCKDKDQSTMTQLKYYIGLLPDLKERCDYYMSIKEYKLAFEEAKKDNNPTMAQYISDSCTDPNIKKLLR